ncbi:hypothetical protein [Streptomyces sp. NPDC007984]|uniref:hypothetical protein n=1 Tax=Streptomyces sp. NPDC007984 TaxID=3364801 RepID=UPI0036ED8D96
MAADQLPAEVGEFATYLNGLLARLDPAGGWCAVFWQRDPEGMRACLDGRDMPPWDVVEALLQDLAGQYGPGGAGPETERARALHAAALAVHDTRPGGRDALAGRLDGMLREQRYAAERQAALARHLTSATTPGEADALRRDLAWAQDDHTRAAARCAELRSRLARVDGHARAERGAGAGAGPQAAAPQRGGTGSTTAAPGHRGGPGSTTAAPGRYDAAEPEPEGPGRQHPTARGASGAASTDAAPGPSVRSGPQHPQDDRPAQHPAPSGNRNPWGEPAPGSAPNGFTDPAGSGAGRPTQRHPAERPGSGEAAAGIAPGGFTAPAGTETPGPGRQRPAAGRAGVGEAAAGTAPKPRKRRRGGARFAGMVDEEAAPLVVPPTAVPELPDLPAPAPVATGRTPRGARFAGAGEEVVVERAVGEGGAVGADDRVEVGRTVEMLGRLRCEGRSGEAHALLAEVAGWEPGRFPLLAERLHLAGLDADWQTLLWEAASLPAGRLVAAADALVEAGRAEDGRQMLRQGVARPPGEVGRAVLALAAEGRHREVRVLLDAYVRARVPEEAARSAEPDPRRLVPLLLEAARGVSEERHWDLVHALRVAGYAA